MEISENTKQNLKDLIKEYYDCIWKDEYFIPRICAILDKEEYFGNSTIKYYNDRMDSNVLIEVTRNVVRYNLNVIDKEIHKQYGKLNLSNLSEHEFTMYKYFEWAIHEIVHIWQNIPCAENNISLYSEINYLYMIIHKKFCNFSFIDKRVYGLFHDKCCFERHANITAAKIAIDIFDEFNISEWAKWQYIKYLTNNGYYLRRGKVVSPVERTLKYFGLKDDIIYNNDIPFELLFEHGLKISSEDYHMIYDDILTGRRTSLDYDETVKKIKLLSSR